MGEININIEGYNVNGICVGCLNYNRKMFYRDEVKECFKMIANIEVPDGLSVQVCWECLAAVHNSIRFRNMILKSFEILMDYSQKNMFLNSPEDLSSHAIQRISTFNIPLGSIIESDIKEEIDIKPEKVIKDVTFDVTEPKENEIKIELDGNYPVDFMDAFDDMSQDQDLLQESQGPSLTSEDEILSKVKVEKEKKRKKRREKGVKKKKVEKPEETTKSSRKLKNLPEDLVELYTMTEAEMWLVREKDVASDTFREFKYKCDHCILRFNTRGLMSAHINGKHCPKSSNVYQCDVCKAYFITKDNLSVHRSQHLSAYKCRQCGLITTVKRIMLNHECAKNLEGQTYPCVDCSRMFSNKSKLAYHRSVCHQEKPQCDCCGKVFANKMTLKYHLKILPQNNKPKEKLIIQCKGCDKVFYSKKSHRAHAVIHEGVSYPCPICGKLFQWKRNLSRHTRNHRERDAGATHSCRECGKTFASRDCYNNHMRLSKRHVSENSYIHECHYCSKKFPSKWCMIDHIDWDHLKRIKYQCSVCFKPFKTAKIMVAHMNNIHEGKKRETEGEHLCEICGKSYKTVKRLKGHVWAMHTNRSDKKSFKCSLCPATFTWQTSIYKHVKMMHDNKRVKHIRIPPKKPEPYPSYSLLRSCDQSAVFPL